MTRQRDTEREHSIPATHPAGYRSLTFSRSEPDALSFLNECSSDLLLVDSSGSYQTAHVEGTDIELVIASTFLGQCKPLKLSAQRSYCIRSGSLKFGIRHGLNDALGQEAE